MVENNSVIFGPVPSRRLGRSLGINNIPPKICSYSCAYCQLGRTLKMQIERQAFYNKEHILSAVKDKIGMSKKSGEIIDYIAFVPDGEPTLDINLGTEIDLLKSLGIPVAVITNSSLIFRHDVRRDLMHADWVSLKIDAMENSIWHKIDHPHRKLDLGAIIEGALEFSRSFKGKLTTETMLAAGINDSEEHILKVADFLSNICPGTAYISVPTRPPAEKRVLPPDEQTLNMAYNIFKGRVNDVEYLTGYEGDAFAFTGNVIHDILSITAVHPMRKDAVELLLSLSGKNWLAVEEMLANGQLAESVYGGHMFYLRKFKNQSQQKN